MHGLSVLMSGKIKFSFVLSAVDDDDGASMCGGVYYILNAQQHSYGAG